MKPGHVTAIVVVYNAGEELVRCVEALMATRYRDLDVLLLDNGSTDPSHPLKLAARFARVSYSRADRNLGYAGGVNRAMRWLLENDRRPTYYALVNQDCMVAPGWLGPLVATLAAEPSAGMVGARIYEPDGYTLQHAGGIIHPNGLTDHIGRGSVEDEAFRQARDCDYVTGALCAFRAGIWDRFGPLDDQFFPVYFEEADFCARLREGGFRIVYVPESEALHEESSSLGRGSRAQLRAYHRNRMRFAARHLLRKGRRAKALATEFRWLARGAARGQLSVLLPAYTRLAGELLRARRLAR